MKTSSEKKHLGPLTLCDGWKWGEKLLHRYQVTRNFLKDTFI
jgi:hypothetical protein